VAVEDIERVEVVRGPGSSLYGTNAVLGVINVVTRRPTGAGAVAEAEAGSLGAWRGRLGWDGSAGAARLVLSAGYYTSQGEDLRFPELGSAVPGDGLIRDHDGERSGTALAKAYLGPVQVVAGFGERHKDIPTGSFETVLGAPSSTLDRRFFSFARYEHVYPNLGRLAFRSGFDSYRYEGTYAYEDGTFADFQASAWWTMDAQYVRPVGRHRFVLGGELRLNTDLSQGAGTGTADAWESSRSSQVGALFVQDEIRLGGALLTLGLRHDRYSGVGGTTNPRAALIVPVLPRTTLKLLAGRAFRSPNELEQFYYDGVVNKAAGHLEPERLTTYEVVVERALGASARVTSSVYYLSFRDVVTLETDPADGELVYTNRGASDGHGVELEIEGRVGPVDARASYAYQRVEERGWVGDPPNSPRHLGRLGGSLPLHRRATLGVEAHAVSRRLANSGASVPGYLLTSGRLIVDLVPDRVELMLSGGNLLNSLTADPGGEEHRQVAIPQERRTLRVGLRTRF
jgi:iron complex outermembrane receptor protein